MSKRKVVLSFPPHLIDQPITYRLIRDYNLIVNILRARITPNEWGRMVVELSGNGGNLEAGLSFLAEIGSRRRTSGKGGEMAGRALHPVHRLHRSLAPLTPSGWTGAP